MSITSVEDQLPTEVEALDLGEQELKLPETELNVSEIELPNQEEAQPEQRGRKRPLLYECPKFTGCEDEFELLRKIKKLNRDVDVALTRRRLFIGQELRNPSEVDRVLRINIYHTYRQEKPGRWEWNLKIVGHVLDPETNQPIESEIEKSTYNLAKLAYQVSVVCDPADAVLDQGKARFDWVRKENEEVTSNDGFSITRKGSGPCNVLVYLFLESSKKYFKVSDQLLSITGARPCAQYSSMEAILNSIFIYAKRNRLITGQRPGMIRCDNKLKQIFAAEFVPLQNVEELIKPHMKASQPLMFNHKIKFDGSPAENCECYETLIKVPLHTGVAAAGDVMQVVSPQPGSDSTNVRLEMVDEKIREIYSEIETTKQEYDFFKAHSKSPVDAIDVTISSAEQLLKNIAEYGYDWKQKALASYYQGDWTKKAIRRFISQSERMQEQQQN